MVSNLSLIFFLMAVAVNGNPLANKNNKFFHRRLTKSTNPLALPFVELYEPKGPRQPRLRGTVRVENCGTAPLGDSIINPAIVGGTEATPHSYPWQAAIYVDIVFFCGGTVISEEWVMTAAHCLIDALRVEVVLGAHDLSQNEPSQLSLISTEYFKHENWLLDTIVNDIAMIRLPQLLTFNDFIQPACLPSYSDTELAVGTLVSLTGWGLTSDSATVLSDTLNQVTAPVISNTVCNATFGIVTDTEICIDGANGKGVCHSDSGGPMNYQVGGITQVRGITSYGSIEGCESGEPDAFSRVLSYLDWIEANTGILIDP